MRKDLSRRGAEGEAYARHAQGIKQPRILFLGNLYNPWSTGCLQTLVELGCDIVVGVYDPLTKGAWRLIRSRLEFRAVVVLSYAEQLV
jgi:hypothetical protein